MMQKLVTIYLDREAYRIRGTRSPEQSHAIVEEHLEEYLANGWKIASLTAGGGGSSNGLGCCWVIALLEK